MNITATESAPGCSGVQCWFTFATVEEAKAFKFWVCNTVGFPMDCVSRRGRIVWTHSTGLIWGGNRKGSY